MVAVMKILSKAHDTVLKAVGVFHGKLKQLTIENIKYKLLYILL